MFGVPCRALCRYESVGWTTLRWNSNVHREASLTVTVGAKAEAAVGPRGHVAPLSAPVLQLEYAYGCKPIKQKPLATLVIAAADGEHAELTDPDDYSVRFTAAKIRLANALRSSASASV